MSHHRGYYRVVNGKTIYVAEGGDGQGRAAELHERTAIGKHRGGGHYLRATDAKDGKLIEAAARHLNIPLEKRRAGANHHGRVGAYDHYHTESLEHAKAIHDHLKGQAATNQQPESSLHTRAAVEATARAQAATDHADRTNTPESHAAAAQAHREAENAHFQGQRNATNERDSEMHQIARGGHASNADRHASSERAIAEPGAKSEKAWEASRNAWQAHRGQDGYAEGHDKAAAAHDEAAKSHLQAHGAGGGRGHYLEASRHLSNAHQHISKVVPAETAAEHASRTAKELGASADAHRLEDNHESHGMHAEKHLLAIEAHGRARDAHTNAGMKAAMSGDQKAYMDHNMKSHAHQKEVERHTVEMAKGHDEIARRRDAAYGASEHANAGNGQYTDRHEAAAEAHRHAAKINYDSDTRASHETNAKMHEERAAALRPTQDNPRGYQARRDRAEAASSETNSKTWEGREHDGIAAHEEAAYHHREAGNVANRDGDITASRHHSITADRHMTAAQVLRTNANRRPAQATEPVTVREATPSQGHRIPPPPSGMEEYGPNHDKHLLTVSGQEAKKASAHAKRNSESADNGGTAADHRFAAGKHAVAARRHKDAAAEARGTTQGGLPADGAEGTAKYHDRMAQGHGQKESAHLAAASGHDRPMQKAITEATVQRLEHQMTKVGGDPIAMAALEMRKKAALGQNQG